MCPHKCTGMTHTQSADKCASEKGGSPSAMKTVAQENAWGRSVNGMQGIALQNTTNGKAVAN